MGWVKNLLTDKDNSLPGVEEVIYDKGAILVRSGFIGFIVSGWYQSIGNRVVWMMSGVPEFLWGAKDLVLLVLPRLRPRAFRYDKWGEILLGGRDFIPWGLDLGATHGPVGFHAKGSIVPWFMLRNQILPFKEADHGATCTTPKDS